MDYKLMERKEKIFGPPLVVAGGAPGWFRGAPGWFRGASATVLLLEAVDAGQSREPMWLCPLPSQPVGLY